MQHTSIENDLFPLSQQTISAPMTSKGQEHPNMHAHEGWPFVGGASAPLIIIITTTTV